ncbi:pyridoxamine 5'-phosphate oxidase family protein [Streptomyces sp. NBC_01235]|uniref:pyridoxamine 5'-phosphate oxidase family protein n=1 Tax=Streptomyces sp. NBC_01235 TaxID=2903788 RepID=UPI002E15C626|nr:pyridoxamine 5'-phosphate oxidase family protein [Streptomyces sp. NBC_01235]
MKLPRAALRLAEVSGAEALRLVEGSSMGRLVYAQGEPTVVRPARHVGESGRPLVRTPVQAAVAIEAATYQVDELGVVTGTGRTVTLSARHRPGDGRPPTGRRPGGHRRTHRGLRHPRPARRPAPRPGPAEVINDPIEAAVPHCLKDVGGAPILRTPSGRSHGPHDTVLRIHPETVTGFRLTRTES